MNNCLEIFSVQDYVVVITGANGQLGVEYCKVFLDKGAMVAALDLSFSTLETCIPNELIHRIRFYQCDITNRSVLKKVLGKIKNELGSPSVLINNAAIDSPPHSPAEENGPFETYPESSWDRIMDVNAKAVFLCCQIFGGEMAKQKRGSIINISSIYGVLSPDQSLYNFRREDGEIYFKPVAYSVSKSAILNLTRYLAVYWAKTGVRVNTLVLAGVFNNQPKKFLDAYCARIPIGRMAGKNEYNGAILFLASNASLYMTGSQIVIDGGWTAI